MRIIYWGDEVATALKRRHPHASLLWKTAHLAGLLSLVALVLAVLGTGYINITQLYASYGAGVDASFVLPRPALVLFVISSATLAIYCLSLAGVALSLGEPLWALACALGCITIVPLWPLSTAYQYLKGKEVLERAKARKQM